MQMVGYMNFGQGTSDITGFNQDNREFAVVGLVEDAAIFVDITDPKNPFEVGRISGNGDQNDGGNGWRDLKYWNRHVYIGTEAQDGVRVVSVNNPDNPVLVDTITDFTSSHNIHIDTDGYLYVVGAAEYDIWIYNLSIPESPELVGTWNGEYLHDIEVYNNKLYGAAIYSGYFYIIDVSDKTSPTTIVSHNTGIDGPSTHDCAVTENENYLIIADEKASGHISIWDISDYENINRVSEYMTHPDHSVHNVYIRPETNLVIMSYYVDGTRILDITDPANPIEVGFYDTSDLTGLYDGNWGTYAYLPSGYIVSSDRQNGLFIFESPLSNSLMQWEECPDCNDEIGGDAYEDECGTCDNDHENDCVQDCAATWGGDLEDDECGVCDGPGAVYDCGCSNISDGVCDCDGNIFDCTGECGGTDMSCLGIDENLIPDTFTLNSYPNPFNPVTQLEYSLPYASDVSLTVHDLLGRQVEILHNGIQHPNNYTISWDASNYSSGVYFIKMNVGDSQSPISQSRKVVLLK